MTDQSQRTTSDPFLVVCHSYETEPSGYRQTQNVTNKLTFVPRIEDDNTTLYCVATNTGIWQMVTVVLNVTFNATIEVTTNVPSDIPG